MAEDFDRKHQKTEPPYGPKEMFQIPPGSIRLQPLIVVVEPCQKSASQRNNRDRVRRLKAGDNANQIAGKNKKRQRYEIRMVGVVMMADDFLAHVAKEAFDALHRMLQAAGLIDRQSCAHRDKKRDQEKHHEYFHREAVGDW